MPTAYQNPLEASQGLTSAFSPTSNLQKQAIANAAALVPTKKSIEPTVLGSTNIDQKNQENISKVAKIQPSGQMAGGDGFVRNADQTFAEAPSGTMPTMGENGQQIYSSGGMNYAVGPSNGKISNNPIVQKNYDDFTSLKSEMDSTGAALIENIKNQFTGLIKQQEQANNSSNAGVFSLLQRGGSLQTASSSGIIQSQVSYGLQQIADLNAKEQGAIIAAKQAMQNNDYKILDKQLSIAQETGKAKQEAAQKMSDSLIKAREAQTKQIAQSTRDSAIGNLMEQGITDPNQMLDYLNFDDQGNMKGDFTADEIAKTLKNLSKEAGIGIDKLTGEAKNYAILKDMPGMLPPTVSSLGGYLKWNRDLTTSKAAGAAGNGTGSTITSDQFSNEQIALSVIPTQLRNSDTELKRYLDGIRLGLKEGKTPYQVADELMGYKIQKPTPFTDSLRGYIAVANLSGPEIGNVARLLNSGNNAGAIAVVENKVLQTQKQNDPESFVGEATPRYYAEKVAQIKQTIKDAGLLDAIGPLEGNANTIFSKIPFGQRAQAVKIQSQVTSLVAEMRNHLAGTAVTDSEKKFLEPLISSLSDKKGVFINKLDEISSNGLTRYNQTRASGGLPELNESQLLDKAKRVSLYSNGGVSNDNSIDNEVNAETKVTEYGKTNPTARSQIEQMITDGVSYDKIMKALNI